MQPPPAGSGGGLPARGSCWAAPAELTRLRDGIPAPNTELRGFRFLFLPLPKSTLHSPLPPPPRQCSHPLCSGGGRGGARKCFLGQPVQRGITGSGAGAGKQSPAARRGEKYPGPSSESFPASSAAVGGSAWPREGGRKRREAARYQQRPKCSRAAPGDGTRSHRCRGAVPRNPARPHRAPCHPVRLPHLGLEGTRLGSESSLGDEVSRFFYYFFPWYSVGGEEISADPKSLLLPGLRASL